MHSRLEGRKSGWRVKLEYKQASTIRLTRNCCLLKRAEIPFFSFQLEIFFGPFFVPWVSDVVFCVFGGMVLRESVCGMLQAWLMSRLYSTAGLEALRTSIAIETVALYDLSLLVCVSYGVFMFMCFSL
jgi:hypothetical protein